jgi:DNA-binding IclR family transcriptional regulator
MNSIEKGRSRPAPPRPPAAEPAEGLNKNHHNYFVPGMQRGLEVLEAIGAAQEPLGTPEIARRIGVSRSAAFRLIYTLRYMGFLEPDGESGRFTLGPRILNLGFAYLASMDIVERARPELERLRDRTNVSAHLSIRNGAEVLYLSCIQTLTGFHSTLNVGARLPAYASPMGWLLLSELSSRDLAALYGATRLQRLTDRTPADLASLLQAVGEAGARGFVLSRGILEAGGSSIAAPVVGPDGKMAAAIDIAGPDSVFDFSEFESRYLPEVQAAARAISARIGHAAPSA